jgi:hypothetical protein
MNRCRTSASPFACSQKDRGFTLVAVMTLALGIAANNTVFTLMNAVFFRGMPFDKPEQIIGLRHARRPAGTAAFHSELRSRARLESRVYGTGRARRRHDERQRRGKAPERYFGGYVSANTFSA